MSRPSRDYVQLSSVRCPSDVETSCTVYHVPYPVVYDYRTRLTAAHRRALHLTAICLAVGLVCFLVRYRPHYSGGIFCRSYILLHCQCRLSVRPSVTLCTLCRCMMLKVVTSCSLDGTSYSPLQTLWLWMYSSATRNRTAEISA